MAATIDLKSLWEKVFPKQNPFFEKDGKHWCRYDSIEVELFDDYTEARFCWNGQSIFYIRMSKAQTGDTIRLLDIQGITEVKVDGC